MKRFPIIAAGVACLLATAPLAYAQDAAGELPCDTGLYEISADHEGARANACRVFNPRGVILTIDPEDPPPINPSPWYGFHVRAKNANEQGTLVVTLRYSTSRHRYAPRTSIGGREWNPLPERQWLVHEDGRATMELKPGADGLFVSAQENLGLSFYAEWRRNMAERFDGLQWRRIGESRGGRPIFAAKTAPGAPNYLLFIGRQHPPEIPGALMFKAFAERLLEDRSGACDDPSSAKCAFYSGHSLVFIPNLNPDGVALGHWRHNLDGTDLNRDWGTFAQPETQAVQRLIDSLEEGGSAIAVVLDFHSTWRNVFYVPTLKDATRPPAFATRWLRLARASGAAYAFERAPRSSQNTTIAKNYFYRRFGVPAITVETGDDTPRGEIASTARVLADALVAVMGGRNGPSGRRRSALCPDFFCYMAEANRASLVMLSEEGLVNRRQAQAIAAAMMQLRAEQEAEGAERTANYLPYEERLVELAGEEAADLHLGRSRQDLHGVVRRMLIRDQWLALAGGALKARSALLDLAEQEASTPIPAYTHGVQAQPTTLGHYLLAFSANLQRDLERYREGYARMNSSPLGAAALGTSGFALNRERLARLLGFAAPVDNSYDANFVSSGDLRRELANILELSAIPIGQLVENLHTQYHNPRPWILLDQSAVSISTIMPQKRNPRPLDRVRSQASKVLGGAQTQMLLAHNTNTGMHDYRDIAPIMALAEDARLMYRRYERLIGLLRVDREQALDELQRGFSTMTEVADMLVREAGLPFRTAHRFASALTDYGRANRLRPESLSDEELEAIYRETVGGRLPVSIENLRRAMDPVAMLGDRKGLGGPQAGEVRRMLNTHRESLEQDRAWLGRANADLLAASLELHQGFAALAPPNE
ncbi:MAG: lyase family protein [Gammaproteobacteria bacterium]|nr:lyase family protein [Gammaproteobacteria bacterium]